MDTPPLMTPCSFMVHPSLSQFLGEVIPPSLSSETLRKPMAQGKGGGHLPGLWSGASVSLGAHAQTQGPGNPTPGFKEAVADVPGSA